jgi:ATP-dependent exoDNAse (exonuclease V) alpha subunit
MTINKGQGQTLTYCGVDLENNCFSQRQLYVALSRIGIPDHL